MGRSSDVDSEVTCWGRPFLVWVTAARNAQLALVEKQQMISDDDAADHRCYHRLWYSHICAAKGTL